MIGIVDDNNPYHPGTVYEAEPRPRGMGWILKLSMAAFVLAIFSMLITQACLTWSFFENTDFEGRMQTARYPMKVAVALCGLGFVLLVVGILFRRRAEAEENSSTNRG